MQTIQRSIIVCSFFIVFVFTGYAQTQKYWISFDHKEIKGYDYKNSLSEQTIVNRTSLNIPLMQVTDIPVSNAYKASLADLNISVVATSKWLNAVTAYLTSEQVEQVKALSFVTSVDPLEVYMVGASTAIDVKPELMHTALKQMKAKSFTQAGVDGSGIRIGVIDAGFYRLQEDAATKYLVEDQRILGQRDFIDPTRKDLITVAATSSDDHGRQVVRMIAGYDTSIKAQYGMAVNASFYLARTENGDREYRGEEDMWIMAMEWMDSLGIRLISTSLGYATKMDDPSDNYKQSEIDGKTARITKAAQIAFQDKGIFLTVSAGNEGDSEWRIISAPADAEGALSVGATNSMNWDRIYYSSIGPENLPYLKPNVSCFSPNGTSFSCPAVAGFVACLMKYDSTLTNVQLKEIMQRSAHLYPYGNNYIGYGIPQADRALELTKDINKDFGTATVVHCSKKVYKAQLDKSINLELVLFNKKNETIVIEPVSNSKHKMIFFDQNTTKVKKGLIKIRRTKNAARTTAVADEFMTLEIIWE